MKKVCLVTNALYEGMPLACAMGLARDGFAVALAHRRRTNRPAKVVARLGARIAKSLRGLGAAHALYRIHEAGDAAARRLVARVEKELGPVGVLVNGEGSSAYPHRDLSSFKDADWESSVERELLLPLHLIRACLPNMKARGYGRVLSFTYHRPYWDNHLPYRSGHVFGENSWPFLLGKECRGALRQTLALTLHRDGITFNDLAPSGLQKASVEEMARELAHPSRTRRKIGWLETAATARFLCSEAGRAITGASIPVVGLPDIYRFVPHAEAEA